MDKMIIHGGTRLSGAVTVSGSKNATLPILMASLLTAEPVTIRNVPHLRDVNTAIALLRRLGVESEWTGDHKLTIRAERVTSFEAPYELVKTMRASFFVLGPLLARSSRAKVSTPGGCAIGARPVNLHITGLRALGARIQLRNGYVEAHTDGLRGARIWLDNPSVGATENIMMAAVLARGRTTIENAAREPEVQDLAKFLVAMGANVRGAGTHVIEIDGVEKLHGADHEVIPDRIEAGSLMIAAAITGGDVSIRNVPVDHVVAIVEKLRETGVSAIASDGGVHISAGGALRPVELRTLPYPGFPTDLQAQMMALLAQASGTSVITETIFENRFMHALELMRMGADIVMKGSTAVVRGVPRLQGAPVMATDLRASMGLILAGLSAENSTEIGRVYHLDRGYEALDAKLSSLGAQIERVKDTASA
jgi:UDP-N-acetylglucosamine 1-carboxyvinyltransferase